MSEPLLLATRNEGKLRELRPMFDAAGFSVIDLNAAGIAPSEEEDSLERFSTFEENALAKAHYFLARSGLGTIADDSGLALDALHGAPGVHSKRWSGQGDVHGQALDDANNARMLAELSGALDRGARYVCAAAYADWHVGFVCRGETAGRMIAEPRGDSGFGYDPFFQSDELGVTFGHATREQKETISHRGRAFRVLLERIRAVPAR